MQIRVLEWIGLIMADMLSFLLVSIAFLYTFTEPVQKAKMRQLVEEQIEQQSRHIAALKNRVESMKIELEKKVEKPRRGAANQIYVRLFPGDLIVLAAGADQPLRVKRDELLERLKKRAVSRAARLEVVLSAELGVSYDQLTDLAEDMIKNKNVAVRFGW